MVGVILLLFSPLSVVVYLQTSIHKITFLELSIIGNMSIEAVDILVPVHRQMSASGTSQEKKSPGTGVG